MKISPDILISKKCHSHQQFLASKCEWGLPKLRSSRCRQPPWFLLRSWGNARSKVNRRQGWPQIAEVPMKGLNSASPEVCVFPYRAKCLNLTPNLSCSDCLLSLLQTLLQTDSPFSVLFRSPELSVCVVSPLWCFCPVTYSHLGIFGLPASSLQFT